MKVAVVFLASVALAAAASVYPAHYEHDYKPAYPAKYEHEYKPAYPAYKEEYGPAYYNFDYAVKDDYAYLDFGHSENRNGDNTKGEYFVLLPDGRRQTVTYYVDGYSGYVADVKYSGEPKYDYKPEYKPAYKPAYEPAYKPAYKPAYEPAYQPSYKPAYKPEY